MFDLAFECNNC